MIQEILDQGRNSLTEYESKKLLAFYGIPTVREKLIKDRNDLIPAARDLGYPIVLKGCSPHFSHKTEQDVIRLDIRTDDEALEAFDILVKKLNGHPVAGVLVQEMVRGGRELMAGMTRDVQFGPCVMFGLGGIFSEILKDVAFRVAPLSRAEALRMMETIRGHSILDAVRGMQVVDREALAHILVALGTIGLEIERISEIDINPLIVRGNKPVAVDALVVLS